MVEKQRHAAITNSPRSQPVSMIDLATKFLFILDLRMPSLNTPHLAITSLPIPHGCHSASITTRKSKFSSPVPSNGESRVNDLVNPRKQNRRFAPPVARLPTGDPHIVLGCLSSHVAASLYGSRNWDQHSFSVGDSWIVTSTKDRYQPWKCSLSTPVLFFDRTSPIVVGRAGGG
jgi:hypothetical protein